MNALRAIRFVVLATVFALALTSAPAAAQTEPDFGDPPETLLQGDDEGVGRQLGEPSPVIDAPTITADATQLLILGGVIAILSGLAGVTFMMSRRRRSDIPVISESQVEATHNAILATSSIEALCREVAAQATPLTGATGVFVTIDEVESTSGGAVDISNDLVVRVNRERELAKNKGVSAVPVIDRNSVVGLIAIEGGNAQSLVALGRFVNEAYLTIVKHAPRLAAAATADAELDGLTGVGNRRRFNLDLAKVADDVDSDTAPVSLALFDVDHFHYYNEAHGKQAGNEVLRSIAELIASSLRESDVVYRYSGVQFVALLPGANVDNAFQVVERIRQAVESTDFDGGEVQPSGRMTLSIGIAEAPADETSTLVDAADFALAQAKLTGRNKVVIEADIR